MVEGRGNSGRVGVANEARGRGWLRGAGRGSAVTTCAEAGGSRSLRTAAFASALLPPDAPNTPIEKFSRKHHAQPHSIVNTQNEHFHGVTSCIAWIEDTWSKKRPV